MNGNILIGDINDGKASWVVLRYDIYIFPFISKQMENVTKVYLCIYGFKPISIMQSHIRITLNDHIIFNEISNKGLFNLPPEYRVSGVRIPINFKFLRMESLVNISISGLIRWNISSSVIRLELPFPDVQKPYWKSAIPHYTFLLYITISLEILIVVFMCDKLRNWIKRFET